MSPEPVSLPVGAGTSLFPSPQVQAREPIVLGLDPSFSGTGAVLVDGGGEILASEEIATSPRLDLHARLKFIAGRVLALAASPRPAAVFIEEPVIYGRQGSNVVLQLAGLHYILAYQLREAGFVVHPVSPSAVKKWVTGKGSAHKDQMLLAIYRKWGVAWDSNNLADAHAIARFGLAVLEGRASLNKKKAGGK